MMLKKHKKLGDKLKEKYSDITMIIVEYHVVYLWDNGGRVLLIYDNTPEGLFKVVDAYFSYHTIQERLAFIEHNNTFIRK